ncbi:hypothetical protein K8640_12200 [Myxococcus sp. XM-1-1-1]|uniref:hypothetical protein n=1 Tax=Myxococcus sp. XM-1-1-1 TaxID=2874602 RepID=UPI001CC1B52B|nr:hypothetical protein [Myxococcus sp. XM-1-1-1]MBZ4408979.1 hypothetical protein [Myxococcus sp. XM-1-1-1]
MEQLHQTIAQGVFDGLQDDGWTQATYSYLAITLFSEEAGLYQLADGQQRSFFPADDVTDAFEELRPRMVPLNPKGHPQWSSENRPKRVPSKPAK